MTLEHTKTLTHQQMEEVAAITKRIRRKLEIMRMDQKSAGSVRVHDTGELLSLLDMLDRKLGVKQ